MVSCRVCGESVPYILLRMEIARCSKGHELGVWVRCGNEKESHVYLMAGDEACPYCGHKSYTRMSKGDKVKCMHVGPSGPCIHPYYRWFEDGPPCHMNHLSKTVVVKE
ncbi:MAG: hypothetical protein RMK31_04530 [Candidatus Caldarchaeum sp.]|nr:hypothetical protein [Candidatus Caldarchaeum sp.]